MYEEILIAGFGGQGTLFAGRLLAEAAMQEGWQVACAVSYGPEMRGSTANSTVIISSSPIGSLAVTRPTIAIIMNEPSMAKFGSSVAPGGLLIADQSLVTTPPHRGDIQVYWVPATQLAGEMAQPAVANVILLGALLALRPVVALSTMKLTLGRVLSVDKRELLQADEQALEMGRAQGTRIAQEVK